MGYRRRASDALPRRRRPPVWWAVPAILVAAVAVFLIQGSGGGPDHEEDPGPAEFVFLFVWETSTAAWQVELLDPPLPELIHFDPAQQRLTAPADRRPSSWDRLLVHVRGDGMGLPFRDQLLSPGALPAVVPIDAPAVHHVLLVESDELTNGIDNTARQLAGPLEIVSVGSDGTVEILYGATRLQLAPGEAWGEARIQEDDGTQRAVPLAGSHWEDEVEEHLAGGRPITVLRVYNYGSWPAGALEGMSIHQAS